ncbi:hypothetical protein [Halopiger djelfimassiliensis]|uniref:hypothetical protein n=1 Tax=Halopiger djelfimassiliensis TaxID=1293047 RepID=UPI000677AD2B|nr:hypothetical protein [Halopiger djelfimassiliensis]
MILIGAITLAFIILGIVVVFNGVLYTETISSSSTSHSTADATMAVQELDQGIGGIAHQKNINSSYDFDDAVDEFSDRYRNTTVNAQPVAAAVTDARTDERARVATGDLSAIESNPGNNASVEDRNVGHLLVTLDPDGGRVTVTTNESGTEESVDIEATGGDIYVDGTRVADAPARVDPVTGEINDSAVSGSGLDIIDPTTEYDEVELEVGSGMDGEYELVAKDDTSINGVADSIAMWSVEIDTTYESNDVSYEQTHTVDIYGDRT